MPRTETLGEPASGYCDIPPAFVSVLSLTTVPETQRRPSPNVAPSPPPGCNVPWKYSTELFGICEPINARLSAEMLATPAESSRPPTPSELWHPAIAPTGELLP